MANYILEDLFTGGSLRTVVLATELFGKTYFEKSFD